jgi:pyruvate,water dikinase
MAKKRILLKGISASSGVVIGKARLILDPSHNSKIKKGEILVTEITNPLFTPAILRAGALITDVGGALSHAAIIARELGIPAIVGTAKATKVLKDGMQVVVDGKKGVIYE